jgi:uncharacterized RDD family membrane protein YckC
MTSSTPHRDGGPYGEGVVFAPADMAGFLRRCAIVALDFLILLFLWIGFTAFWMVLEGRSPGALLLGWLLVAWFYLVVVKWVAQGTVGCLATGVWIVNLQGRRPSFHQINYQLLLYLILPFGPLLGPLPDLLWLEDDPRGRSLRDRLSGTYLVRKAARPVGRGRLRLVELFFWSLNLSFLEVGRPRSWGPAPPPSPLLARGFPRDTPEQGIKPAL